MLPSINDKILTIIYKSGKGKIKMAYFLDNSNPDIIVVFEQESIRFPGEFDRENKLYKISDIGQEPELIFDANTVASNKDN